MTLLMRRAVHCAFVDFAIAPRCAAGHSCCRFYALCRCELVACTRYASAHPWMFSQRAAFCHCAFVIPLRHRGATCIWACPVTSVCCFVFLSSSWCCLACYLCQGDVVLSSSYLLLRPRMCRWSRCGHHIPYPLSLCANRKCLKPRWSLRTRYSLQNVPKPFWRVGVCPTVFRTSF